MKANVGGIDRALRIVLGLVLLSLVVVGPKTLWGLVGLVPPVSYTHLTLPTSDLV